MVGIQSATAENRGWKKKKEEQEEETAGRNIMACPIP